MPVTWLIYMIYAVYKEVSIRDMACGVYSVTWQLHGLCPIWNVIVPIPSLCFFLLYQFCF